MSNNKKFVVEAEFMKLASDNNLTLDEFLLLIYFENTDSYVLDFEMISKKIKISLEKVMEAFNSLLNKKLITLVTDINENGKRFDRVSLDNFYNEIKLDIKKEEKEKTKEDIFATFESEFRRPLTGIEFEIIKAWCENGFTEEIIIEALKESVYNGVTNIRYIDAILNEWKKKGIKTKEDIEENMKNKYDKKKFEDTNILNYDWLNEDEK